MPEAPAYWTNVPGDPTTYDRVSVSEIRELNRCTRKHLYGYRQGLRPAETPGYFTKGRYLHAVMASFLRGIMVGEVSRDVGYPARQALEDMSSTEDGKVPELPTQDVIDEVNASVAGYLKGVQLDKIKVLAVEQEFYADIGLRNVRDEPVLLYGFVDAVVTDGGGATWIVEHKTASRAWSLGQFLFDYQTRLYAAAMRAIFAWQDDPPNVEGAVFNFFYPKRNESKIIYSNPEEEARLIEEVQGVISLRDSGLITRQPHWGCNDCGFKAICHAELIGGDADYIRATQYTVDQDKVDRFSEED